MHKVSFFFLLLFACVRLQASTSQDKVYQGYSGGMMVHTGYLFGKDKHPPNFNTKIILPLDDERMKQTDNQECCCPDNETIKLR